MDKPTASSRNNYPEYQIKVSLNPILCNTTFKNNLRKPLKGKGDNLLADTTQKPKIKREQVSHIFTGEENAKQSSHKAMKYIGSTIMFNDAYVDNNPKINKSKAIRYEIEKQIKTEKPLYSDELYMYELLYHNLYHRSHERRATLERKIKDTYGSNPIAVLSKEQIDSYNKAQRDKCAKRTEVIDYYMGSDSLKKTFKSMNKDHYSNEPIPKITNENNVLIMQKENCKHRNFRKSSLGNAHSPIQYLY